MDFNLDNFRPTGCNVGSDKKPAEPEIGRHRRSEIGKVEVVDVEENNEGDDKPLALRD